MIYFIAILHVVICFWILFMDGAEKLDGKSSTILFFYPAMTARELRFYSVISLISIPIYVYLG